MKRLTAAQLKPWRMRMIAEQAGVCPITKRPLGDDVVGDHCHTTGMMRAVLPRWVNSCLGRVENWAGRVGADVDPVAFLRGCADYIEFYRNQHAVAGTFHPTHRTEAEKRELRNRRVREARRKANREARKAREGSNEAD